MAEVTAEEFYIATEIEDSQGSIIDNMFQRLTKQQDNRRKQGFSS